MSEVNGYLEYRTPKTSTCAKLSQLSFFGTAIKVQEEYVETIDQTYLLLFAKGTRPGVGARTMTFIKPTAGLDQHQGRRAHRLRLARLLG